MNAYIRIYFPTIIIAEYHHQKAAEFLLVCMSFPYLTEFCSLT